VLTPPRSAGQDAHSFHPPPHMIPSSLSEKTLAVIMGGGAGSRLFPLTKERSKPAVPLAGKYRIVDIPISNCINSGLRRIYVLTQFNSASLNKHINTSYKFDNFSRSFVEILAAQQTPTDQNWYQGTADAVRQNLRDFLQYPYEYFVILSGDQLYRMDFREVLKQHIDNDAELTIATLPVTRELASDFGIMHTDARRNITRFVEKPKEAAVLDSLRIPPALLRDLDKPEDAEFFQANMGIYVFNRQTLIDALDNDHVDFGKHVIPSLLGKTRVQAFIYDGYWEDIGTIRSFFEANLLLTSAVPPFNFFDTLAPIYTHARFLPASKINGAQIKQCILSDGCIITDAHIEHAVIGVRSYISEGTTVRNSIIMGADFYDVDNAARGGGTDVGIGRNCVVEHAIIDKNARIGDGCVVTPEGKPDNMDGDNFYIRDGIVIVPKNATLPAGTWI
jgi:glucose-1-phosphate adenylyltransferase